MVARPKLERLGNKLAVAGIPVTAPVDQPLLKTVRHLDVPNHVRVCRLDVNVHKERVRIIIGRIDDRLDLVVPGIRNGEMENRLAAGCNIGHVRFQVKIIVGEHQRRGHGRRGCQKHLARRMSGCDGGGIGRGGVLRRGRNRQGASQEKNGALFHGSVLYPLQDDGNKNPLRWICPQISFSSIVFRVNL